MSLRDGGNEGGVGRKRTYKVDAFGAKDVDGRLDDACFFITKKTVLSGVRIEAQNRETWGSFENLSKAAAPLR